MASARCANPTARRLGLHARLVNDRGGPAPDERGLGLWLARVAPPRVRGVVHIVLVSDARIRALNKQFLGKDAPTDVLSFPVDRNDAGPPDPWVRPFLGDIVIATGVARRQAADAGHHVASELRVLALHGLLHLLGYDHEHDAGRMRRLEARLRRKGGLRKGLIERASDSS
jgi:probable rRNA maturation factor